MNEPDIRTVAIMASAGIPATAADRLQLAEREAAAAAEDSLWRQSARRRRELAALEKLTHGHWRLPVHDAKACS